MRIIGIIFCVCCSIGLYGQDVIEVSYDRTVYLVFDDPIKVYDIGTDEIGHRSEGNKLYLKADVEQFIETNMLVETVAGYYFTFRLKFNNEPNVTFYPLKNEIATYHLETGDNRSKAEEVEEDLSMVAIKTVCERIENSYDILLETGDLEDKFQGKVGGIYADADHLYFKVSLWNESNIQYNIDLINFKIDAAGKKERRLTASFIENLTPVYVHNADIKVITHDQEITKVFVFEKFTIDKKKRLFIEVIEENGDRDLEIILRSSKLIDAEAVVNVLE